jgi:hypothetical protein
VYDLDLESSEERLMPPGGLGHGHCGVIDKAFLVLKRIWLEAGPSKHSVAVYRAEVRICHTDDGTEHHVRNLLNVCDFFYSGNLKPTPEESGGLVGDYLFPAAIGGYAWNHILNNLAKRILSGLPFFPSWLKSVRAVIRFLKNRSYKKVVIKHLKDQGLEEEALAVSSQTVSLAEWRWETFFKVSNYVESASVGLVLGIDKTKFKMTKSEMKEVSNVVGNEPFFIHNSAVHLFTADCRSPFLRGMLVCDHATVVVLSKLINQCGRHYTSRVHGSSNTLLFNDTP